MSSNKPSLMWYMLEDSVLVPHDDYYAGAYEPGTTLTLNIQLWNNRLGVSDAGDALNPKLVLFFDSIENTILLKYCKVTVDSTVIIPVIELNKAVIEIGRTLYGKISSNAINSNYADIQITIGPIPNGLRNELKNLFIDVEYDQEGGI